MRLFAGNDAVGFIGASCSGLLFMQRLRGGGEVE
jgi:hypothetical protein